MKKVLSLLLVCAMLVGVLPATVFAQEAEASSATSSTQAPEDYSLEESILLPLQEVAGTGKDVLLIQTNQPWRTNSNVTVLESLERSGYHKGFTITSVSNATTLNFADYAMIIYANDQSAESYGQYSRIRAALEQYIYSGGTVLFGACDNGWAAGTLISELPGGVTKFEEYSNYNYIADSDHPIVTGELTGGQTLTDSMLYSTYCSHTSFHEDTLPAGSNVIFRSKNTNSPTLVEYPYGNGWVVLSGLTWEYAYDSSHPGEHSKNSFDDYMAYGLYRSGLEHKPEDVNAVPFPFAEDAPSQELAEICSLYALLAYRSSEKNAKGQWVDGDDAAALGVQLHNDKFEDLYSYNYNGKKGDYITVKTNDPGVNTILYTIGHRLIKDNSGNLSDQIIVVFRGTYKDEWYGNFDVTSTSYDSSIESHWSFQKAVNEAMSSLSAYIREMVNAGEISTDDLSILLTGHSRGAAVSNMMAHELTDIRNGRTNGSNYHYFSNYSLKSVCAYTFATPNVATYKEITSFGNYNNIFNYCFTDDFVPNLPLEGWSWGKYGQTYWATAAKLVKDDAFKNATRTYFGEKTTYKSSYTESIAKTLNETVPKSGKNGVKDFYEKQLRYTKDLGFNLKWITKSMHWFVRTLLGGTMQGNTDARDALIASTLDVFSCGAFRSLAQDLVIGSSLDDVVDIEWGDVDFKLNGPLNYAHQCGSYYSAMRTSFYNFAHYILSENGYAATLYSDGAEEPQAEVGACNEDQVAALKQFLANTLCSEEDNVTITNAELLEWDPEDVSTWTGVTWENGSVTALNFANSSAAGPLDLTAFPDLAKLNVTYCTLTELNPTDAPKLTELFCSGNMLTALDLSGMNQLTTLECAHNQLTTLNLSGCSALTRLNCGHNLLTDLDLSSCPGITYLLCAENYLNTTDAALTSLVDSLNADENTYVEFLPQMIAPNASFDSEDVAVLKSIALQESNNNTLKWDLEDPASWMQTTWVLDSGTYHLESVDLSNLGLSGNADFSDCDHLETLILSENQFNSLSARNCDALETLWYSRNMLNKDAAAALAAAVPAENIKHEPQYSPKDLNEADVAALDALTEKQDLNWEKDFYANNDALTWELQGDGTYILTGIDFAGYTVSGILDLSSFAHLKDVACANSDITDLQLPNTIEAIEESAFAGCTGLRSITLPASVTKIGNYAFDGCKRLMRVTFSGKAPELGDEVFANCQDNLTLVLSFDIEVITLSCGEKYTLSTANFPAGSSITWISSMESVASVNNGVVKARAPGATMITAVSDTGFTASCIVEVPEGTELPKITALRIAGKDRHETAFQIADMLKSELGIAEFDTMIIASGSDSADALAGSYLAARKSAPILLSRGNSHQRNLDYINANLAPDGIVYILGGTAAVPQEMEDLLIQSGISCRRLSGSNRFETNLAILNEAGMDGDEILVSTAYNFADSLSASASGKPILLVNTRGNALSPAQETWLTELQGKTITIIGGESAVSAELENALSAFGSVRRIYGAGREATSVEVAENYFSSPSAALLAYSRNFPDGLCGGPLAYAMKAPLLLVNAGQEAAAKGYVSVNAITSGYILGGTTVVSDDTARTVFGLSANDPILTN